METAEVNAAITGADMKLVRKPAIKIENWNYCHDFLIQFFYKFIIQDIKHHDSLPKLRAPVPISIKPEKNPKVKAALITFVFRLPT